LAREGAGIGLTTFIGHRQQLARKIAEEVARPLHAERFENLLAHVLMKGLTEL
jgi:hypothetical protein